MRKFVTFWGGRTDISEFLEKSSEKCKDVKIESFILAGSKHGPHIGERVNAYTIIISYEV